MPARLGHSLVIPKKHVDYIFDLDDKHYKGVFQAAKKIAKPLKKAMKVKRVVVDIEGFAVPHVHLHLIPSNYGHDFCEGCKVRPSLKQLAEVGEKIRKELKKDRI